MVTALAACAHRARGEASARTMSHESGAVALGSVSADTRRIVLASSRCRSAPRRDRARSDGAQVGDQLAEGGRFALFLTQQRLDGR
jgi:hypothetical protein